MRPLAGPWREPGALHRVAAGSSRVVARVSPGPAGTWTAWTCVRPGETTYGYATEADAQRWADFELLEADWVLERGPLDPPPLVQRPPSLWLRLIHWLARRLPRRDILAEDGAVYLERYRVFGGMPGSRWKGPSVYLHRFRLPDQDVALHNHPWPWAVSLVLAGGYTEQRLSSLFGLPACEWRRLKPGRLNILGPDDYHRVSDLYGAETWTLFVAWPRTRSWGFWLPLRGHVPWRERLAERGIDV